MDYALTDRYLREEGTVYLTGVQALVRVLFDLARRDRAQGLRTGTFVSGYEGSPLGGYDLELGRQRGLLAELDVVHRPGLNEEIAATSVMGSQTARETGRLRPDGVAGVWYGKSPGLGPGVGRAAARQPDRDRPARRRGGAGGRRPGREVVDRALRLRGHAGRSGDTDAVPGRPAGRARFRAARALPVPVQRDVGRDEDHHGGRRGASTVGCTRTGWCRCWATLGRERHRPSARLLGANLVELERSLHTVRLPRALEYARLNPVNRIVSSAPGDRVGIIAAGKTYLDVREALTTLGLDEAGLRRHGIRVLKVGMIWPLEPSIIGQFADGLDELIVVEEKRAFLETSVKEILYGRAARPAVHGKLDARGAFAVRQHRRA